MTTARDGEGFDLKIERLRHGLSQQALADQMGVNRSRVAAIESQERPSMASVNRYRSALVALTRR
jgi:transcriptional regulator with XRE-family HTH domain